MRTEKEKDVAIDDRETDIALTAEVNKFVVNYTIAILELLIS